MNLCCPICDQPLVPHSSKSKSKASKSRRIHRSISNKQIIAYPPVVAAQCGDLYHKICLRQYCSDYGKASRLTDPVECPACGKAISLTRVRVIDFAAHEGCTDKFSKDIQYLEMMTKELDEQFQDGMNKYESTEKALRDLAPIVNALQNRVETCQMEMYRHKLLDDTKRGISETAETVKVMKEHNITLVRTLLSILKECSPTTISAKDILPTELIPALELIKNDKVVLYKLVDIIAPKPNGLSTDKLTLTAQILKSVGKTSLDDRLEQFHEELKKQVTLRKPATPQSTRISIITPLATVQEEVESMSDEKRCDTAEVTWIKSAPSKPKDKDGKSPKRKSGKVSMQDRIKKLQKAQEEKNAVTSAKKVEVKKASSCSQTDKLSRDEPRAGQLSDISLNSRKESLGDNNKEPIQNKKQENDIESKEDATKLKLLFARRVANNGDSYNIITSTIPERPTVDNCNNDDDSANSAYYNITQLGKYVLPPTTTLSSEQSCSEDESGPESKCPSDSEIQTIISGLRTVSTQTMEVQIAQKNFNIAENGSQSSRQYLQDPYNTYMETPAVCGKLQVKKQSCSFWIPNKSSEEFTVNKENALGVNEENTADKMTRGENLSSHPSQVFFKGTKTRIGNISGESKEKMNGSQEIDHPKHIAPDPARCINCPSVWCVQCEVESKNVGTANFPQSRTGSNGLTYLFKNNDHEKIISQTNQVLTRNSGSRINEDNGNTNVPQFKTISNQPVRNEDCKIVNPEKTPFPVRSTGFSSKDALLMSNEQNHPEELRRKASNLHTNHSNDICNEKSGRCSQCQSQRCIESKEEKNTNSTYQEKGPNNAYPTFSYTINTNEQENNTRQNNPDTNRNSVRDRNQEFNSMSPNSKSNYNEQFRNEETIENSNNNTHEVPNHAENSHPTNSCWKVIVPPHEIGQSGNQSQSNSNSNVHQVPFSYDSMKSCCGRENRNNSDINNNCENSRGVVDYKEPTNKGSNTLHSVNSTNNIADVHSKEDCKNYRIPFDNSMRYENEGDSNKVENRREFEVYSVAVSNNVENTAANTKSARENESSQKRPGTAAFVPQNGNFPPSNSNNDRRELNDDAELTFIKKCEEKSVVCPPNVVPIIINVPHHSEHKNSETVVTPLSPKPTIILTEETRKNKSSTKHPKIVPLLYIDKSSSQSRSSSISSVMDDEIERKLIANFISKHFNKKQAKAEKKQNKKGHRKKCAKPENMNPPQQPQPFQFIPLGQVQFENFQQQFQMQPGQVFQNTPNSNNLQYLVQNSDFGRTANLSAKQQKFYQKSPRGQSSFSPRPPTIVQIVPDRNFVYDPYSEPFHQEQRQQQFFPFTPVMNNMPTENPPDQHFFVTPQQCVRNQPLNSNKTSELLEHINQIQENSPIPFPNLSDVDNICRMLSPPPPVSVRYNHDLQGDEANELYRFNNTQMAQGITNEAQPSSSRTLRNNVADIRQYNR